MTTEQKAKAYDRALEKARMYHENAKAVREYTAVARYENIFPELHEEEKPLTPFQQCLSRILYKVYYASTPGSVDKFIMGTIKRYTDELIALAKKHEYTDCQLHESEDEKIMEELIGHCKDLVRMNKEDKVLLSIYEPWLTYLEKQKEQKPVLTAKEAWKEMRLEVYAQASGNRHEPNYSDDSTKMFSLCDIDEIFEKIGNSTVKQKPAEWSDEDESCWNLIWDILDGSFTASKEGYKKAADWFLKNCPKGTKSLRPNKQD